MNLNPLTRSIAGLALAAAMGSASATTYSFNALLSGTFEVPPVTTPATGSAFVSFNDQALTVSVAESFSGLIGGSATAGHIHCCTAAPISGTAPVVVPFTSFPNASSGTYSNTFTLASASFASLLAGAQAGEAYVNIHNAQFPGGEIQGFLAVAAVPEPETYALLAGGLGVVAVAKRRRRNDGRRVGDV